MSKARSVNFSVEDQLLFEIAIESAALEGIPGRVERTFKRAERRAAKTGACGTRVSCRRGIPHARGRAIKRMQIKTFYLNDNITLVDATALA